MEDTKDTKTYGLGYLLKSEESLSFVKEVLGGDVEIAHESSLKHLSLAYPIEKETHAFFGFMHLVANPDAVSRISSQMELEKDHVLRYIIVVDPAPIQQRDERISRDEGSSSQKSASEITNEDLEKTLHDILE